ncbi:MAG: zinc ribbon domain-containing protein [Anaerolineales bacterium]
MARKTLGFIPLIWECPYCQTKNPGPIKTCTSCGAPQPEDVEFTRVDEETFNFIKDEALIRMAKAGPDIHCPFCGTRNPSTAETCSNCGGELNLGGKYREAGQKVETTVEAQKRPTPVTEPQIAPSRKMGIIPIVGIFAVIAVIIVAIILLTRTNDITATVIDTNWERSILIEEYRMIENNGWWDEIPNDANVISCSQEYRYTSDEPVPNSTEECGEPYVVDTGTGVGEVVQDCTYDVYDEYCEYQEMQWTVVDTLMETGANQNPVWPIVNLGIDQREADREESYTIVFSGDGDTYTFTTSNVDLYQMANIGSEWNLSVNQLGGIQSIEPAN